MLQYDDIVLLDLLLLDGRLIGAKQIARRLFTHTYRKPAAGSTISGHPSMVGSHHDAEATIVVAEVQRGRGSADFGVSQVRWGIWGRGMKVTLLYVQVFLS